MTVTPESVGLLADLRGDFCKSLRLKAKTRPQGSGFSIGCGGQI